MKAFGEKIKLKYYLKKFSKDLSSWLPTHDTSTHKNTTTRFGKTNIIYLNLGFIINNKYTSPVTSKHTQIIVDLFVAEMIFKGI